MSRALKYDDTTNIDLNFTAFNQKISITEKIAKIIKALIILSEHVLIFAKLKSILIDLKRLNYPFSEKTPQVLPKHN